jgi:two-component system chemotaxis sensor kinase CheA
VSGPDPAQIYRQEAAELLEQLEQALLDLEHTPTDADLVNTTFRALHTIKGSGAMFGFDRVAAFTHHVETAFDLVRKAEVPVSAALIAVALSAKDQIRRLIEQPESASDVEGAGILAQLQDVLAGSNGALSSAPPPAPAAPLATIWRLRFRLPKDAMAMGTNPLLLLDELRALGACTVIADASTVPPLEQLDPSSCHIGWEVTLVTTEPRSAIEQVFLFVLEDMQLDLEELPNQPTRSASASMPKERQAEPPPASPPALTGPVLHTDTVVARSAGSIRVPAERLDALMDQVGELVIAQSRLKQVAAVSHDVQVKAVAEEIERLALELRDTTMGARLVPIGQLFGRFRRLVHDLSHELGKEIALVLVGEDTELDKTLIERLANPLIHLIRNAVDHGVQLPEERVAAGKSRQGRITLSARHLGHEVLITIADDGAGLDRARIQQRAEDQGLIAPGAKLTDSESFQLIMQPGFSTGQRSPRCPGAVLGWMSCDARSRHCAAASISPAAPARGRKSPCACRSPWRSSMVCWCVSATGATSSRSRRSRNALSSVPPTTRVRAGTRF